MLYLIGVMLNISDYKRAKQLIYRNIIVIDNPSHSFT